MSSTKRAASHFKRPSLLSRFARAITLPLVACLVFALSSAGFAYAKLQGNIQQTDISALVEGHEEPVDPAEGRPYNILVLGSDVREGEAAAIEDVDGMRSDTTMLVHFSADRSHIEVVSIPRDTLVTIPKCTIRKSPDSSETYTSDPQKNTQFNWAFSTGGKTGDVASAAACTITTVERLTGITIDGYIVVNFSSFQDIVNALEGVPVYFDEDINEPKSGLNVLEGCRLLDGEQALAYARMRYDGKDGSDISRISRQQGLVKIMLNEALSMNLFTDSRKLYRTLDAGTKSLSTSQGLGDITTLTGLAYSLRNLDLANVHFITMPYLPAGNRVDVAPEAEDVWSAINDDTPVWLDENGTVVVGDNLPPNATDTPDANGDVPPEQTATAETPAQADQEDTTPECTREIALKANYD